MNLSTARRGKPPSPAGGRAWTRTDIHGPIVPTDAIVAACMALRPRGASSPAASPTVTLSVDLRRRASVENAIERLIAALDGIDGDPDIEPGGELGEVGEDDLYADGDWR